MPESEVMVEQDVEEVDVDKVQEHTEEAAGEAVEEAADDATKKPSKGILKRKSGRLLRMTPRRSPMRALDSILPSPRTARPSPASEALAQCER
jgi:hypothetical protein